MDEALYKQILDTIYKLCHTKDVDRNILPSYCLVQEIANIYSLSEDEVIELATKNGYKIMEVSSEDESIKPALLIADKDCSYDIVKNDYSKFYDVEVEVKEIVQESLNNSKEAILEKISNCAGYEVDEEDLDFLWEDASIKENGELLEYIKKYREMRKSNLIESYESRNIVKIAKNNGFEGIVDTKEMSIHHIDDTKFENGLKNNSYNNLWFIKSDDWKDRELVHKIIHFMDRTKTSYEDILDKLEKIKLYQYDDVNNSFVEKTLKIFKESLNESSLDSIDRYCDLKEASYGMNKRKVSFNDMVRTLFKEKILEQLLNTNIIYCDKNSLDKLLISLCSPKVFFTLVSNTCGTELNNLSGLIQHHIIYGDTPEVFDMSIQDHTSLHNRINFEIIDDLKDDLREIYNELYYQPCQNFKSSETYVEDVYKFALFENCLRAMGQKLKILNCNMKDFKEKINRKIVAEYQESLNENTLNEYKKDLRNQSYENTKLKNQLIKLANENNLELVNKDNLTVHHLDDTVDNTIKKYANNNIDNVLFVDASTIDANTFHQILHYCKNNKKDGLFSLSRTIKQLLTIPVYWVDENGDIHKLSFRQAFKKISEELENLTATESSTLLESKQDQQKFINKFSKDMGNKSNQLKTNLIHKNINEKIVKKGSKYQVQSEKGKNMGIYNTRKEAEKRLKQVHYFKHMNESQENPDIEEIDNFLEDIYDLRKLSIAEDGEYGMGNLIFKEMRNMGYLDNLRELKRKLKDKQLSLEHLKESIEKQPKNRDENIVFENHDIMIQKDLLNGKKTVYSLYFVHREKGKGKTYSPTTMYFNSIEEAKKYIDEYRKDLNEKRLNESKQDELNLRNWLDNDQYADLFLKFRQAFKSPENDYYYWIKNKQPEDLIKFIDTYQSNKQSKEQKHKEIMEGAKLLGEGKGFKVYHITTWEASKTLGQGAKWCISMKDDDRYWNEYTSHWLEFYFFISSNTKYAVALYPQVFLLRPVFISKEKILKSTNIEIYNAEDILDYGIIDKLPLDLIPEEIELNIEICPNGLRLNEDGTILLQASKELKTCEIPNSVEKIGKNAFEGCENLKSIVIPDNVKGIGSYAFSGCKNLTSIVLPNNIESIENELFANCYNLTSIIIPNKVKTIGHWAFTNCSSLTSITIPDSVTSIGYDAFQGCYKLESITIPNSVTKMGIDVFRGCENLTIKCNKGSYADTYAQTYIINRIYLEYIYT